MSGFRSRAPVGRGMLGVPGAKPLEALRILLIWGSEMMSYDGKWICIISNIHGHLTILDFWSPLLAISYFFDPPFLMLIFFLIPSDFPPPPPRYLWTLPKITTSNDKFHITLFFERYKTVFIIDLLYIWLAIRVHWLNQCGSVISAVSPLNFMSSGLCRSGDHHSELQKLKPNIWYIFIN